MFKLSHTVHLILLQLPFEFQPHNKWLPQITKSMTQSFSSSWKIDRHNKILCFGWKTKILSEMSWASNLTYDSILMRFRCYSDYLLHWCNSPIVGMFFFHSQTLFLITISHSFHKKNLIEHTSVWMLLFFFYFWFLTNERIFNDLNNAQKVKLH